jgi:DNA-binding PadR family transcriptional regulator
MSWYKMMDESIERYFDVLAMNIKANKEIIILSVLSRKPMCGLDLIKEIYSETEIFLSQGTIYPILYLFEERGILQCKHGTNDMRTKIYYLTPKGRELVQKNVEGFVKSLSIVSDLVCRK